MWQYYSENISGNLHDAVRYLNDYLAQKHPEHEIVTLWSSGRNSIVVYRIRFPAVGA